MNTEPERVLVAFATLFLIVTITATSLRCYVRIVMVKSFGADDALAVFAMGLFIATAVGVLLGIHYSHGWHMVEIPLANIPKAMFMWFLVELLYTATMTCLRLSIALFLCRIIVSRTHFFIIWSVMGVTTLYSIAYFLFMIFQCWPVNYFWTQFEGKSGKCVSPDLVGNMTYVHGILSIVADWTLAILPAFLVWKLQMNPRTKTTLTMILGMGAIGSCAVIVRFPYVVALEQNATDFLYYSTNVVLWTSIEPGLAITASALATLRPLFQTFLSSSKVPDNHGSSSQYKASGNCMSPLKTQRSTKSGGYIQSGAGRDGRTNTTEENLELGNSGGEKGFRSVVTTTIMSPATASPSRRWGISRSASQEALRKEMIFQDRDAGDLSPAPLSPASLHPTHADWSTRIKKTVDIRTESAQADHIV